MLTFFCYSLRFFAISTPNIFFIGMNSFELSYSTKKKFGKFVCKHFVNIEKNEQSQANKHIYTYISQ